MTSFFVCWSSIRVESSKLWVIKGSRYIHILPYLISLYCTSRSLHLHTRAVRSSPRWEPKDASSASRGGNPAEGWMDLDAQFSNRSMVPPRFSQNGNAKFGWQTWNLLFVGVFFLTDDTTVIIHLHQIHHQLGPNMFGSLFSIRIGSSRKFLRGWDL